MQELAEQIVNTQLEVQVNPPYPRVNRSKNAERNM
jgi:hypothetical protein